jgi:hypothetical protein
MNLQKNHKNTKVLLDEISNVPPDGEAGGPEAAGETPLCSDQETARSGNSDQTHMQLCRSSTQNKFVLICQRLSFDSIYNSKSQQLKFVRYLSQDAKIKIFKYWYSLSSEILVNIKITKFYVERVVSNRI